MLRFRKLQSIHYDYLPCPKFFDGKNFSSIQTVVVPTHDEYNLGDLIDAGVKVSPVSTDIFHDDRSVSNIPNIVVNNPVNE